MYQAIRNYVDPQRPKSDSHVTKLAKKVVRKTSKHIRKTLGGSSIHGGTANRPSKSTTKEDGDDEDDDAESLTEPSRPKSESYAYLASPPMTPLVNNTTAKLSDILKVSSPTTSSNHHRGSVEFYGEDEDEDDGHYFYQPSTSTTSHRRNSAIKPPTAGTVTRDGLEALINGCLEKSGLNQLVQKLEDSPTSEIQREETLTGDEAVTMTHMPGNIGCVGIAKSSILHCEFGQRTILNMSNTNMQKRLSDFRYLMQLVEKRVEEKGKWIAHPSIEQANEMFEAGSSFKLEGYLEPVNANVKECKISLGCFPTGDSYLNHG
ncbi:hypothetical protein IV203_028247 [Nitzschia inconspicua]|nr:hypothetical protein IV203_028247 [Nitzschia inconspicua]